MNETVSIIIPTFNRSHTVGRAIESALSQTYDNVEVVVVDDCSTDDTQRIVESLAIRDRRLVYHRQPMNTNIPASWDAGLRLSSGDYFAFLGDDDVLRPEFVARRVECFEADARVAAVFGRHERRGPAGELRCHMPADKDARIDRNDESLVTAALVTEWFVTASMYRKSLVMPAWHAAANDGYVFDVGFHVRIIAQRLGRVRFVPGDDVVATVHDGQVSATKSELMMAQKDRLMTALLSHDLPPALARRVIDEVAHWHIYWGRTLLQSKQVIAAQLHFLRAARVRPLWAHTWKQMAKGLVIGMPVVGPILGGARTA